MKKSPSGASPEESEDFGSQSSCVYVPVAALAVGEDGKQGVAPGVGDSVDLAASGKVTSVTGGVAEVTLETVNGQPVSGGAYDADNKQGDDEPDENDMAAMEKALRGKAATADDESNYV